MKKLKYKILISSLIGSLLLFAIIFSASFYFIYNLGQSSIHEEETIMREIRIRAGEAGKGFAVVADEIGKLADNSTEAVAGIQNITKVVVASVNDLNQRSKDLLEFLSNQVIKDYKSMVSTGETYNEDASTVNEMVSDYSATAQELTASIQNVVQSLSEVSSATEETAKGTQNIVESTTNINTQAADLLQQSDNISDGLQDLIKAISKFKI